MKYFALLTLLLAVIYALGFVKKTDSFEWMDRNFTTAVKGFAIITVLWAHSGGKFSVGGIQFIAGIGVSLFIICSGYGLEMSYEKNGLTGFWKKRFFGACVPFWIVELVGLLITQSFTLKKYMLDFAFIKPATGYGWFMRYIVICYLIFYVIKKIFCKSSKNTQLIMMFVAFALWFVLESLFFANSNMPFLQARQMLSFPCGVLTALKKDDIEAWFTKAKSVLIFICGCIVCFAFMAVTQLNAVKSMPYIISNIMSLFTCFPLAVGILAFGKEFGKVFENKVLLLAGTISYELYLVHAFTLDMINSSVVSMALFIVATALLASLTHLVVKKSRELIFVSK